MEPLEIILSDNSIFKLMENVRRKLNSQFGLTDESIKNEVLRLDENFQGYIETRLGGSYSLLTNGAKSHLRQNYLQYQLFSSIEYESLARDKKEDLENMIEDIKNNNKSSVENNNVRAETISGIEVF